MTGKGDKPRPYSVPLKKFDENWEKIFKSGKKKNTESKDQK